MKDCRQFYIDGQWVAPVGTESLDVINPATEEACGVITLGTTEDVDNAVAAARRAFNSYSLTSQQERVELLKDILDAYLHRYEDFVSVITDEIGAPVTLSRDLQALTGKLHLEELIKSYPQYSHIDNRGSAEIFKEPVGVCGFITPWNWPINQVIIKVAPALAVGCTIVLKPSELSPLSAHLLAEVLAEAGVPPGVFNLVDGSGATVGNAIAAHPGVDMVSFTGSTTAGIQVAKTAADTVKRVTQELGGKSANIILEDADLALAVSSGIHNCFMNSGQNCNAPARMLVPGHRMEDAANIARETVDQIKVGDPTSTETVLGPVVSNTQYQRIQGLIQRGIDEGATLVCGGLGNPDGLAQGCFVKPTVFVDVTNEMAIAQREIFGPVLCMLAYDNEQEAIKIANDSPYGLASYVQTQNREKAQAICRQLRTGMVYVNGAPPDFAAPFGGYKQSGNGREWGLAGIEEFLETKAIMGL